MNKGTSWVVINSLNYWICKECFLKFGFLKTCYDSDYPSASSMATTHCDLCFNDNNKTNIPELEDLLISED